MFDALFGRKGPENLAEQIAQGASIVDVRSPAEFAQGHAAGAINIPLDQIPQRVNQLKSLTTPILLCCASGARSGQAQRFLSSQNLDVQNVGSWKNLPR